MAVNRLQALAAAVDACRRCPLWRNATQGVPGEGRLSARVMMVGEQPGDQEDRAGHPFVGPAGQMLDRAIADAGLDRRDIFVTNAVKHFKNAPRGKRRIHRKPNAAEIETCRWWLERELDLVRPKVVIALGATAASTLLQRRIVIGRERGKPIPLADSEVFVTIHPSYLLRLRDRADRTRRYRQLVRDLQNAGLRVTR
jgi:uracil-DNA glycosylase family protein